MTSTHSTRQASSTRCCNSPLKMTTQQPHLALLDGSNLAFRAYFAMRNANLTAPDGMPVGAIHGYLQIVRASLQKLQPTHAVVAFDPKGGSTFRNQLLPQYKQNRSAMDDDLVCQWPHILTINDALNLPRICIDGFEADDVIATLARQAERQGWRVSILSSDKDLMQLVGANTEQVDPGSDKHYDSEAVAEKWGVLPTKIHDLLALTGDTADNIPGVDGIGPKTAALLLKEHGSLEGVLAAAGGIKQKKRRENLLAQAETARTAYRLVALDETVPMPLTLDQLQVKEPNKAALGAVLDLFRLDRLRSLFGLDDTESTSTTTNAARTDHLVNSAATLQQLCAALRDAELVAIDSETDSLACRTANLVGLSFATEAGSGWYLPLGHRDNQGNLCPNQLDANQTIATLKPILEDPSIAKCGHNLKFDRQILRRVGVNLAGVTFDSMLLAYSLDPSGQPPKLDRVAEEHLNHRCIPFEAVAGKGVKQITFDRVAIDTALPYAAEDAEVAWRLTRKLSEILQQDSRLPRHTAIELPLSIVLADMEWQGITLDHHLLGNLSIQFGQRIAKLEQQIQDVIGENTNLHSPKQLGVLLFETLGLPGGKRTKSGQWSTTQSVLEKLAFSHEIPKLILEMRSLSKLKSTYSDALPKLINPQSGRVHTSYNQAITSTGRLSSSDPNLQNIPIRNFEGREIRRAFIADEGCLLIAADYSQIELRLMAHLANDAGLIAAFAADEDIHAATAAAIHQVAQDDVTRDMRRGAKAINFGIIYGISGFGLAKQLGISRREAQGFIDAWFKQYPGVKSFMEQTKNDAKANRFVETLMGHRINLPEINDRNSMRRQYAERLAINAPLQGSAADLIKLAMINLHQQLAQQFPQAHLLLQVHDELVIEAPSDQAEAVSALTQTIMESAVTLKVPLKVDVGIGQHWLDAHEA
ncbi:MAG: DNA polymerase I [Mariprofundales bacterium]